MRSATLYYTFSSTIYRVNVSRYLRTVTEPPRKSHPALWVCCCHFCFYFSDRRRRAPPPPVQRRDYSWEQTQDAERRLRGIHLTSRIARLHTDASAESS